MKFSTIFSKIVIIGASIMPAFSVQAQWADPTSLGDSSQLPVSTVPLVVDALLQWMLYLVGFLSIIGFVISGIMYLTAAGDDSQIKNAKQAMKWSIVGVIVALMGYVIVLAATGWLGGEYYF